MLNSLRIRLVVLSVCLTALSLALCSTVIYLIVQRELIAHVDAMLVSQGSTLAALIEYDARHDTYEFTGQHILAAEGDQLRFHARTAAGETVAESTSAINDDPLFSATQGQRPHAWSWQQNGEPWRGVMCTAPCTLEDENAAAAHAPQLSIRIARPSTELNDRLRHIAQLLAVVTIGLSLFMGLVIGLSIGRALKPLSGLTTTLAAWSGDQKRDRLPVPSHPSELVPVITTLNDLFARMEVSMQRERATGSAIAHEIRTPLAGLRVVIEVALSRERDAATHVTSLHECFAMVTHVQRMVESLLLLSRCEQGLIPLHVTEFDIATWLHATWEPFAERAQNRGLTLAWTEGSPDSLTTDAALMSMVLRNLFDNAVSHADAPGIISVQWMSTTTDVTLTISNPCTSLRSADLERIFVRFWRSDQARTIDDQHTGLGLCLALDLTRACGGHLTPALEGDNFSMTLTLPRHQSAHVLLMHTS